MYRLLVILLISTTLNLKVEGQWDIIVTLHDQCVISTYYTHTLNDLHREFSDDDFNWTGIFSFTSATTDKMTAFKNKYNLTIPLVLDYDQSICSLHNMHITPEVVVLDRSSREIMYKGRIDNAYARIGKKRPKPNIHNLRQALRALQKGDLPIKKETEAIGCYITPL